MSSLLVVAPSPPGSAACATGSLLWLTTAFLTLMRVQHSGVRGSGVGSALSVPSLERAGMTSSVLPSRHSARTLAGSDVASVTPLCTLH